LRPTVSIAQKVTLFVETFYKDVSTLLVYEKIIEVDSTPINELAVIGKDDSNIKTINLTGEPTQPFNRVGKVK
jgi:hypothetical protein